MTRTSVSRPVRPDAGRAIDVALLACVALSAVLWLAGVESPVRTVLTVLSLGVAPGWGLWRMTGAAASLLTLVFAVAVSVALIMVTGLVLVTRLGWEWAVGVNVLNALSALTLTLSAVGAADLRRWPGPQGVAGSGDSSPGGVGAP